MRSPLRDLKPMQLLWFIGILNLIATLAVVMLAVKSWHLPENQHLPAVIKSFGLAVIFLSLAMSITVEWLFQRRLRSGTWTDAMLARSRRYMSHPALTVFAVTMFLFSFLIFIVSPHLNGALFPSLPVPSTQSEPNELCPQAKGNENRVFFWIGPLSRKTAPVGSMGQLKTRTNSCQAPQM